LEEGQEIPNLGVRYTTVYEKGKLGHQLFVHRDANAAINIADIYISLAVTGKRPERHSNTKSKSKLKSKSASKSKSKSKSASKSKLNRKIKNEN